MPDCIKNLQGNTVIPPQHFIPGGGMSFDQRTFPGIEAPSLIKDLEQNIGPANVMKHRSGMQPLNV
jgi:hypothetical protein